MTDVPSELLLRRAADGDGEALEALIARHLPALRGFVRRRMGPLVSEKEDASDIVQSACREALQGIEGFEPHGEGAFRQWLFATAMHKILQRGRYWRADRRHPGHESPAASEGAFDGKAFPFSPSRVAMGREDLERVEQAFAKLPETWQDVLLLSRVFGLSHAEIARQLDKKEGAVRVLLHRGLARLSVLMNENDKEG